MTEATDLASAATSADVRVGLRAALALRRLAERLEAHQVDSARRQGWSWQQIAAALEVSKQAVHQKYAGRGAARASAHTPTATDITAPTRTLTPAPPASQAPPSAGAGSSPSASSPSASPQEV